MLCFDRPVLEGSYLLRFLVFFLSLVLWGCGGIASIRRSTSSALGVRSRFCVSLVMVGV